MEDSPNCAYDHVELFENRLNKSALSLGRFCGVRVPSLPIVTSGPNLTIQMITDESVSSGGFKILITPQIGECFFSAINVFSFASTL